MTFFIETSSYVVGDFFGGILYISYSALSFSATLLGEPKLVIGPSALKYKGNDIANKITNYSEYKTYEDIIKELK